jgi:hypothetical protein
MQKKEQSRKANAEGIGPGESAYLEIWFYPVNRYYELRITNLRLTWSGCLPFGMATFGWPAGLCTGLAIRAGTF